MKGILITGLIMCVGGFVASADDILPNKKRFSYTAFDDASWAIRSSNVSTRLGHHILTRYHELLEGCREASSEEEESHCDIEDEYRLYMNTFQPQSMVNFTEIGFKKIRAPLDLYELIQKFWRSNQYRAITEWNRPTVYHNDHQSPPTIVDLGNTSLAGGGYQLQSAIALATRPILEEWTGQRLLQTSVYGVRRYHNQSILAPHVDRQPLVVSCIINVAQEVVEDWPLEVYDHAGVAHNITMEPGDMVLYESGTVIHGRPFPFNGKSYVNVFVHFETLGPLNADELPERGDLPPYIIAGSVWEEEWHEAHPEGWTILDDTIALVGAEDYHTLEYIAKTNPDALSNSDEFDWQPIHEVCRTGNFDILELLLDSGVDVFAENTYGNTPLDIAKSFLGDHHKVTRYLEQYISELENQSEEELEDEAPNDHSDTFTCYDDASWAIFSTDISDMLGNKKAIYDAFMNGCRESAGTKAKHLCDDAEMSRINLIREQPNSIVNFTAMGFAKVRAPENLFSLVKEFWELNKGKQQIEWTYPTPYHNVFDVPTTVVHISNGSLPLGGKRLSYALADEAHEILEQWSGQKLSSTSVFGVRVYHNQSILVPHVDRFPLIVSCILNVDQDVDEDWPLEVYDHNGFAYNISMKPGDMVLYESASIIHGRPFPMNGRFYANVFMHWETLGPLDSDTLDGNDGLPPYLLKGSALEEHWRKQNPKGWTALEDAFAKVVNGDIRTLTYMAQLNQEALLIEAEGRPGWSPFHEAIRTGNIDIVRFFVEQHGVDPDKMPSMMGTPIEIARRYLQGSHPVVKFLEERTASVSSDHRNTDGASLEDDEDEL